MEIVFLGTGAAWRLPELNCECLICKEMRRRGEKRDRTAILVRDEHTLLIDCGPDIASQLARHGVKRIDGVLITHEHGDHYMGLDELFAYKRNRPKGAFHSIPVYVTAQSWKVIERRFGYLEEMGVIRPQVVTPEIWFKHERFEIFPFKTDHGSFASGSVGFLLKTQGHGRNEIRLAYTSDFSELPDLPEEVIGPDYLIMQSFWLNEPHENRPHHMSFQRAIHFIEELRPLRETFLVHIGDADMVPGDPANGVLKKYEPRDPLKRGGDGDPFPIPLNQEQWQHVVNEIVSDSGLPYKVTVAQDDLRVRI